MRDAQLIRLASIHDSGAANGLLTDHKVGLWRNDGTLLASVDVPAGVAAPLIGTYRSVAITPIVLPAGYYEVAGFVPGYTDKYVYDAAGTTPAGINYYESHVATGAFAFPGFQNLASTKEITANFEATALPAVPEPSPTVLMSLGLATLFAFSRRRLQKTQSRPDS